MLSTDDHILSAKVDKSAWILVILACLALTVWSLYLGYGHQLIENMYRGTSFRFLNNVISGRHDHPLEFYLALADAVFYTHLVFVFGCMMLLVRLVFSRHGTPLIYLMLLWGGILVLINILNPNTRIYSCHGFFHAGIVYQILLGNIPPPDPLLGGEPLLYPWGYHALAAIMVRIAGITPFYIFAVINIVCLVGIIVLVRNISRLLIDDARANVYSVLISIFAVTVTSRSLIVLLQKTFQWFPGSNSTIPLEKITNANGAPLGFVLFLLGIYSVMKMFIRKSGWTDAVILFISIAVCGFLYMPFLPGILAAIAGICFTHMVFCRSESKESDVKLLLLIAGITLMATVINIPYIHSISSSARWGKPVFLNPVFMAENTSVVLVIILPLLMIMFVTRKILITKLQFGPTLYLVSVIVATAACYIAVRMPYTRTEYKFFILSNLTLGILGGIAFSYLHKITNRITVFVLLVLFLNPAYFHVMHKITTNFMAETFVEKNRNIIAKDEEQELYDWIMNNTAGNSMFIDTELRIPVFGHRQLFIGMDRELNGRRIGQPGYLWPVHEFFYMFGSHDAEKIRFRDSIVNNIYTRSQSMTTGDLHEFLSSRDDIYIVVRRRDPDIMFNPSGCGKLFQSSRGNFIVYQHGK